MTTLLLCFVLMVGVAWSMAAVGEEPPGTSSTFDVTFASDTGQLPAGWSVWRPEWEAAACTVRATTAGVVVESPGDPWAVGGLSGEWTEVRGGQAYALTAQCELQNIPFPYRSVLLRLEWLHGGKPLHPAGMLVRGPLVDETGRLGRFDDVLVAPPEAEAMRLSLEAKWLAGGTVTWKRVTCRPTTPPPSRTVRIATVRLVPHGTTPKQNLDLWCRQIDAAGKLHADIVCLGEAILAVGTGAPLTERAFPVPGPVTERLGEAAKRNGIWVVAGVTERAEQRVYNTAVLLDRQGRLAGKYRKVHLPREEWKKGITPGTEYPVFHTDFGTVAIQICYDWFFPEPEAIFAQKGAEIIFAPTWGNTRPDRDGMVDGESTFRVRARDNGVYMVPSAYSGDSLIIDPLGRILASTNGEDGIAYADVDLNRRERLEFVGYWRAIGPHDRMPETYEWLTGKGQRPNY